MAGGASGTIWRCRLIEALVCTQLRTSSDGNSYLVLLAYLINWASGIGLRGTITCVVYFIRRPAMQGLLRWASRLASSAFCRVDRNLFACAVAMMLSASVQAGVTVVDVVAGNESLLSGSGGGGGCSGIAAKRVVDTAGRKGRSAADESLSCDTDGCSGSVDASG